MRDVRYSISWQQNGRKGSWGWKRDVWWGYLPDLGDIMHSEGFSCIRKGAGVDNDEIEGPVAPQDAPNVEMFESIRAGREFHVDSTYARNRGCRGRQNQYSVEQANIPWNPRNTFLVSQPSPFPI